MSAKPASQPINILTKYSALRTANKCKSQIEQKSIVINLSLVVKVTQLTSISRIVWNVIVFLSVHARIINNPFFPLYSLGINSKTYGTRNVPSRIFTSFSCKIREFLRILNTEVTNSQSMELGLLFLYIRPIYVYIWSREVYRRPTYLDQLLS